MIGELKDLQGYEALHDFRSVSASIDVKRGDIISSEKFEMLTFDEQSSFKEKYNPK